MTCFSYLIPDEDPDEFNSAQVQVVWQNEAGREIDLFWVTSDVTEHFATSVPAAGRRTWPSKNSFVMRLIFGASPYLRRLNENC